MKKINIVCALSAAALLIMGCEKNEYDDGPGNPGQVSEAAKTAFETKYPGAQNVRWTVKGEHAVANFSLSTTDAESASEGQSDAWFRNGNGVWDMTATNLRITDLPEAVQEGFRASKYGDETLWTPTGKCDRLERRDVMLPTADGKSIVVYVIGVESASAKGVKTTLDVYFSEDGILVNEVAGAPDNGYEDQLPQQPQGSVEQYLQTNIVDKGGRVIEIDAENGGTEVEALLDNRKLELYFDGGQNWVYTKTDYYRQDLTNGGIPANIVEALKTSEHYTNDRSVDDIEKVETNAANDNRTWWVFELETRWDEVNVYVDDTGIIERPVIDMGQTGGLPSGGDVASFIEKKYPGARILERDYDDGFLEVEILHDGTKKELKFNGCDEWVRTEWEIRLRELPKAVTDAVSKGGYTFDDDEADVVEAPSGKWYEVEVRKGRDEFRLHIDDDGKILRTEYDD